MGKEGGGEHLTAAGSAGLIVKATGAGLRRERIISGRVRCLDEEALGRGYGVGEVVQGLDVVRDFAYLVLWQGLTVLLVLMSSDYTYRFCH